MDTFLLDSSVIVAYLNPYDVNHEKAVNILKTIVFNKNEMIILSSVVIEVLNVVKMRFRDYLSFAKVFLFKSPNLNIVNISEQNVLEDSLSLFSKKNNLSLVDVLELNYSKGENVILVTFDKELKKYSKKI